MTDNKTQGVGEMAALFRRQRAEVDDALDALMADLARVTAERDAAIRRAWKAEADLKIITKEG